MRELTAALVVKPYAIDDCAAAVARALRMSHEEQAFRMRAMRSVVAEFNTYRWAGDMLADAARLRAPLVLQDYQSPWQRELLPA